MFWNGGVIGHFSRGCKICYVAVWVSVINRAGSGVVVVGLQAWIELDMGKWVDDVKG